MTATGFINKLKGLQNSIEKWWKQKQLSFDVVTKKLVENEINYTLFLENSDIEKRVSMRTGSKIGTQWKFYSSHGVRNSTACNGEIDVESLNFIILTNSRPINDLSAYFLKRPQKKKRTIGTLQLWDGLENLKFHLFSRLFKLLWEKLTSLPVKSTQFIRQNAHFDNGWNFFVQNVVDGLYNRHFDLKLFIDFNNTFYGVITFSDHVHF